MERLFINGAYSGRGRWIDTKGSGEYTVEYLISGGGNGPRLHTVKRVFLNREGGTLYEERTVLTFEPGEHNSMRVRVGGAKGSVEGPGYWFERQCHYEVNVAPDNRLEFTFFAANVRIVGVGSATNHGNFTSWCESVTRIS